MFQDSISEKPKNIPVLKKKYQRVKKSPSPKSVKSSKIVGKKRPKLSENFPESPAEEPPFGQLSQKSSSKCVSSKAGIPKTIQKRQLKEQQKKVVQEDIFRSLSIQEVENCMFFFKDK